ncbi:MULTISPECIES: glycosyltransferase family 4 protein [unclassified Pseudodesulfovibrio]|uniref:glycosyltransferase family 4 protein n=1 Tax=unclassified Pseudodesulfovibrio TaxID=2661612 RepID=UPI0013E3A987|nr:MULTISPECIES: glycosyltransferase family 4 protein [unclassified Pseudodesulfovibrio]MCJ2166245.1 glycosyltransferase family 4 protein [Pseudodesulfovibrio sp. S3-i]
MRILSITNDIDSGGAAKSLFFLAENMAALGHEMHIISISKPSRTGKRVEDLASAGVKVDFVRIPYYPMSLKACPIPFWKNIGRSVARFGEFGRLKRMVTDIQPDVIHYNSYTTLLAALPLKGWPAVLHCREVLLEDAPLLPLTKPLVRSRIREAVAISPIESEQAQRIFGLKTAVIFNTAPIPEKPAPMPEGNGLVYGMFSHVSPMKGHLLCIQACAKAADELRRAGVSVRLFGGKIGIHDELYRSIEHKISLAGIGDIVSFQGFSVEPEKEMQGIHLLLRPDLTGHPWGRDIIEAMSQGRPVLATGDSEIFIAKGLTGELVPAGDADAFARALVQLADRDKLKRMGAAAYTFAANNFTQKQSSRAFLECLTRVVGP